jgi:hypothetical protein
MGYTYDINNSKMDKTSSNCLFACHTLGSVISVFVSTFLVAHIYEFSSDTFDYITNVGIYQICVYSTFLLTYWLFSYATDNSNRIWIYRLAQIVRLVFVITIIFFGQNLAHLLPLAGFIFGLSEACYYSSYNVLKQEMVSRKTMTQFSTFITISCKTMDAILPITLGALIQASTYQQTSIYVAVVLGIIIFLSLWIKAKKPDGSEYSLKKYFNKLKEHPNAEKKIKFIYKATVVYGCTTITGNLLNICIMLQFGSSLSLGSITSIIGAIAVVELFLVTKFTKPAKREFIFYPVILFPLISSIIFVVYPSVVTVIVYNLLMAVSKIIFSAIFDIYRNGTLKEAGLYSEIAEHQTIIESTYAIVRVFTYGLMIAVGALKNLVVFKILLVVFSLSYSGVNICLLLYERKFMRTGKDGTVELTPREQEVQFEKIIAKLKNKNW